MREHFCFSGYISLFPCSSPKAKLAFTHLCVNRSARTGSSCGSSAGIMSWMLRANVATSEKFGISHDAVVTSPRCLRSCCSADCSRAASCWFSTSFRASCAAALFCASSSFSSKQLSSRVASKHHQSAARYASCQQVRNTSALLLGQQTQGKCPCQASHHCCSSDDSYIGFELVTPCSV